MNSYKWFFLKSVVPLLIVMAFSLSGCKTTKDVTRQTAEETVQSSTTAQETQSNVSQTSTEIRAVVETETTTEFDTNITVIPVVAGKPADPVTIPVRAKKTEKRKEFVNTSRQKKEETSRLLYQNAISNRDTYSSTMARHTEKTRFPAGFVAIIAIAAVIGAAILIWRLKLFRWLRPP